MMRSEVSSTLSRRSPSPSTSASFVPSGEKEGIITPMLGLPSTKSSSPLAVITSPVLVLASEMYFEPGTAGTASPPNTTYSPSGVSAVLPPYILVCFDKVAASPGFSGRANAAQGRVGDQPLVYGSNAGAVAKCSTV